MDGGPGAATLHNQYLEAAITAEERRSAMLHVLMSAEASVQETHEMVSCELDFLPLPPPPSSNSHIYLIPIY